ncbi:hypothetical protein CsatB_030614 [Cannabis sativa]
MGIERLYKSNNNKNVMVVGFMMILLVCVQFIGVSNARTLEFCNNQGKKHLEDCIGKPVNNPTFNGEFYEGIPNSGRAIHVPKVVLENEA